MVSVAVLLACLLVHSAVSVDRVIVALKIDPAKEKSLERLLLEEVANPRSPRYGHFLTNEDLRRVVAHPHAHQVARALEQAGFHEVHVSAHEDHVYAAAPARRSLPLSVRPHVAQSYWASEGYKVSLRAERRRPGLSRLQALRKRYRAHTRQQGALGDPNSQKAAYGVPVGQTCTNAATTQMVWGPGTYGFLSSDMSQFYQMFSVPGNVEKLQTVGAQGVPGGDNFGECTLDVTYTSSMGLNATVQVSNTNTSSSTEEGNGFGFAFYDFAASLAQAASVPQVLSLSLGSLSADSCTMLCVQAQKEHGISLTDCTNYLQQQRQVCMMDSEAQQAGISLSLLKLGLRGVTITAAAGDGGSHFSFVKFSSLSRIGRALNDVSCKYNFPTFPAASPYVLAVGGTQWSGAPSPSQPIAWSSGGSGFSWQFPRPSYQQTAVERYLATNNASAGFPSPGAYNANGRAYPDLVALADQIPMVEQGQESVAGGTSASAPEVAGLVALLNDLRLSAGQPPLGFLNVALYDLEGAGQYDVTSGNSRCAIDGCCDQGFPATPSWDAMTGWGSPVWSALLANFGPKK